MVFLLWLIPTYALAFTYSVTDVKGTDAFVLGSGSSHRAPAVPGMKLEEGDSLQTGKRSVIFLRASNGHQVHVGESTHVVLRAAGQENGAAFNIVELLQGSVRSIIEKGVDGSKKFELKHRAIAIGVRGTDFLSAVGGEGLEVYLQEGRLALQNHLELHAGTVTSLSASGQIVRTASMTRFEFARAIERAGFGSDNAGGGGESLEPAPPAKKNPSLESMIQRGNSAGIRALRLSPSELNDLGQGESALHVAVKNGRVELIPLFLELKAKVDAQDSDGKTPLMLAIETKNISAIKALLGAGANKKIKDGKDFSSYDYARASGNRDIQNLIAD